MGEPSGRQAEPEDGAIERITAWRGPYREPFCWYPRLSSHLRRGPRVAQKAGSTVGVILKAASRRVPGEHDKLAIGQEVLCDWPSGRFGIGQRALQRTGWNPRT